MIAESNYKIGGGTVAELYDLWAQDYDTDAEDSMAFDSPKEMAALFAFLHRFNGPSGSTKILDAGCGTGLLQRYAAAVPNCEWHGMDLSEGMLQVLKKKGGYETLHAHSISDYPWPYPDEFADVVLCNGVLIYVDDPTCLNEFLRVTKPGGTLYLMVREDGRATYWETMCAHEQSNAWRLKYITEPRENMPLKPQGIIYRIYVYQKAAAPKVSAAGR
jgi:predicted TPR repeat methyltransferase